MLFIWVELLKFFEHSEIYYDDVQEQVSIRMSPYISQSNSFQQSFLKSSLDVETWQALFLTLNTYKKIVLGMTIV